MDPKIASRCHDGILQDAMTVYGIEQNNIQKLDGFESFIYQFTRPDGDFILRISHSTRRTPDLIRGEVDWINFLAQQQTSVARAIDSENGSLVEPIADGHGGEFLCTAFIRAPGKPIQEKDYNDLFFSNYGRLIGRMHALAKKYRVANPAWTRYAWDAQENNTAERQMPAKEVVALDKYRSVLHYLRRLQRDEEGYGLIHQDAHPGNFFVDDQYNLTLFDFDDCVYGHFIYDIAMVLFYTAVNMPDPAAFTDRFMPVFLGGYRKENHLDPRWLRDLPAFMKLREIDLFAAIHFSFEDGEHPDHPWAAMYMTNRRKRIENDVPFIVYDWDSLAKYL